MNEQFLNWNIFQLRQSRSATHGYYIPLYASRVSTSHSYLSMHCFNRKRNHSIGQGTEHN